MPLDQKQSNQGTGQRDQNQHQPSVLGMREERIVVADHHKQHGQREIRVVHTALLTPNAMNRIRRTAFFFGFDQLTLPRNDHHQHVRTHDGAQHGAKVNKGTAPRKDLRERPRRDRQQHKHHAGEQPLIAPQRRAAQQVIDHPGTHNKGQTNGDCRALRQLHDLRINQRDFRTHVIDQAQQKEA